MEKFKKLSRDEMRNVRGGDGSSPGCSTGACSLFSGTYTYYGTCGSSWVTNNICECQTAYGAYTPTSGTSACAGGKT